MTTLVNVKAELGIEEAILNTVLARYISAASKAVEQFCNRTFVAETILDKWFPQRDPGISLVTTGPDPLQLSQWPIVTGQLGTVTEAGIALVEDTDFLTDYGLGQLIRLDVTGYPRAWRQYPITVQYQRGFVPIPSDIEDAVIRTVAQRYFARGREPNLKSENIPGVMAASYAIPGGSDASLSPDVISLLDNYRVPVVA